jgi:N6-L-threonylcarbamoyladenine synthase
VTRVLGIETSCDETSVAILDGSGDEVTQRSLVILSQDVHRIFGGVVPELASRAHLTAIEPVMRRALTEANAELSSVDVFAVTVGPGLVGALLVGVSFGKSLAAALDRPLVGVHHMEGHLFATSLEHPEAVPPFTALLVSGGHTLLVDAEAWGQYRVLGRTRDDAAGEAFDKVAKLLGLPYPGGPHLERLARGADAGDLRFARPMLRRNQRPGDVDYFDFSFSGLKTAVLHEVRGGAPAAGVAVAFQDALVETLVEKTARAAEHLGRQRIVLGGGVAANRTLVEAMRKRVAAFGGVVYAPSGRLATDNAAMIARAGLFHFEHGARAGLDLNAYATIPLPGLIA